MCCETVFQTTSYLRCHVHIKEGCTVHGLSIRLIWVLIREHGPRTHLQCWIWQPNFFTLPVKSLPFSPRLIYGESWKRTPVTQARIAMAEFAPAREDLQDKVLQAIAKRHHVWGQESSRSSSQLHSLPSRQVKNENILFSSPCLSTTVKNCVCHHLVLAINFSSVGFLPQGVASCSEYPIPSPAHIVENHYL